MSTYHWQHEVAPWALVKVPAGHSVHCSLAPGVGENVPGEHSCGEVLPGPLQNDPAGHVEHSAASPVL